ncbi:hypothetical protein jhhlp_003917 [Lomentospora prolificans]|uniref:DNA-directed RNA polymerase III subunit Rpc5 n=1 Tax=Lomentospora prolificans TaxID=41688 RepID=A0A2N3NA38_9PEZI|nr:hypothetical protein jhhlp_003917 [Lomentospora prolificans]
MSSTQDEDDPVVATFNVFLNPPLPENQKLIALHQSVRYDEGGSPAFPRPPSEVRIKPDSGIIEVDVPLDMLDNYDREKGMQYGRALRETMEAKGGGSHGLAGGFGVGAPAAPLGRKGDRERERRTEWVDEVRADRVLRSQTLGGIIPKKEPVNYMIGVFQGGDLHLTPASAFVNLSPQLHHVDAQSQLERATPSSQGGAKDTGTNAAAPSTGAGPTARAIHMTIKTANNGDSVVTETMADRLRAVQSEPWRKLRFVDENELEAWDAFTQTFTPLREIKEDGDDADEELKSLDADLNKVPWLESPWDVDEIESRISRKPLDSDESHAASGDVTEVKAEPAETAVNDHDTRGTRPRTRAPPTTARRGRSKTETRGGSSITMEID